ncbi:hypothetical protein CI807_18475 [Pseudomonas sp. NS1(2017)]|uniref:hypothetical protein n=1 Tax=Pseudomonas sp. NS1(2017) TaxID=2025658 RepID=UPI000BA1D47F|nr:hypothetical protein [Pseudomonas sp. NS1(2017)]ASV38082.1 hypothetical protein CI807_18475 [Pseudomonas sp. NS1(2017)]
MTGGGNLVLVGYNFWAGIGLAKAREVYMRLSICVGLSVTLMLSGPAMADPIVTIKYKEHCGFASMGQIAHLVNSDPKRVFKVVVKQIFKPGGGAKPTESFDTYTLYPTEDRALQCSHDNSNPPYKITWIIISEAPG